MSRYGSTKCYETTQRHCTIRLSDISRYDSEKKQRYGSGKFYDTTRTNSAIQPKEILRYDSIQHFQHANQTNCTIRLRQIARYDSAWFRGTIQTNFTIRHSKICNTTRLKFTMRPSHIWRKFHDTSQRNFTTRLRENSRYEPSKFHDTMQRNSTLRLSRIARED